MSTIGLPHVPIAGVTAAEITPEWIDVVQEIIERRGMEQPRASGKLQIEVKSLNDNSWRPLMLETSRMFFATTEDRDAVLAKLRGPRIPLPPKPAA
jgi:hypothetical protein